MFLAATTLAPWSANSAQIGSNRHSRLFQQACGLVVGAVLSAIPFDPNRLAVSCEKTGGWRSLEPLRYPQRKVQFLLNF